MEGERGRGEGEREGAEGTRGAFGGGGGGRGFWVCQSFTASHSTKSHLL